METVLSAQARRSGVRVMFALIANSTVMNAKWKKAHFWTLIVAHG